MDGIEGLDDGAYAFFGFFAEKSPALVALMQPAYYISGYVGCGILLAVMVLVLFLQKEYQPALVALISFLGSVALIELIRFAVPRARPQNAVLWLGEGAQTASYPSAGVFLFTLLMILLGHAFRSYLHSARKRGASLFLAVLLTVWVCMAQFFLRIHYVTDVIGGLAGATLIGWIACKLMRNNALSPPSPLPQS